MRLYKPRLKSSPPPSKEEMELQKKANEYYIQGRELYYGSCDEPNNAEVTKCYEKVVEVDMQMQCSVCL